MGNIASYGITSEYQEDIAVVAPGTVILDHPATIWSAVVCIDEDIDVVVSFSNDPDGYDNTHRCGKVVINGPGTQQIVFPKGLPCDGLSAIANQGSVDVYVQYE